MAAEVEAEVDAWNMVRLDEALLTKTKTEWIAQAIALDMPQFDYEKELDWAAKNINYENPMYGDSLAHGVSDPDGNIIALVELVHTKRSGPDSALLKMLTIKLGPTLAPSEVEANADKLEEVISVYYAAIVGTVKATETHPARSIKLYGRDSTLLSMLVSLKKYLSEGLDQKVYSVKLEGRWLAISTV